MKKNIIVCCKPTFLFLILHFLFLISSAQSYDPNKVNKKAGEIYGTAIEEADDGKYNEAIAHFNEALKLEPKFVDVYLSRSGVYANLKNYHAAVTDFETALKKIIIYKTE